MSLSPHFSLSYSMTRDVKSLCMIFETSARHRHFQDICHFSFSHWPQPEFSFFLNCQIPGKGQIEDVKESLDNNCRSRKSYCRKNCQCTKIPQMTVNYRVSKVHPTHVVFSPEGLNFHQFCSPITYFQNI